MNHAFGSKIGQALAEKASGRFFCRIHAGVFRKGLHVPGFADIPGQSNGYYFCLLYLARALQTDQEKPFHKGGH